ncbi:MAG: ComF family protein [Patescibacteria group bacterium]
MDYLNHTLRWFAELLWPSRCAACSTLGAVLCGACLATLTPLNERGRTQSAYLDSLTAASPMRGTMEILIYALKYRGMQQLAIPLGDWMAGVIGLRRDTARMFGANPLIVPVPLHPSRLRERDYNQAALLARQLAIVSMGTIDTMALARVRKTHSQVRTHSRVERLDNMRGAFAVVHPETVTDRDIVLVDDVCTTGATLEDCARALKESGARLVSAIVLARG